MDLRQIAKILPLFISAGVFGVTWVVYIITTHQGKIDAPDWLILVPFSTGQLLAVPWYLVHELPNAPGQAVWVTVLWCVLYGFAFGGAAVLTWELQKGFRAIWSKKKSTNNK